MADDPNPALRAEMSAAIAILDPQIEGLIELARTSLEPDTLAIVDAERLKREHLRGSLRNVIAQLDDVLAALTVLESEGGPVLPPASIPAAMLAEMKGERDEIDHGIAVFESPLAASISVNLGTPATKS